MRHQTVSVTGQRLLQLLMSASVGLLGACGTTDTNPPSPPPPPPPATGIGPAGGTVAGPNGAQVVVPAGALSANTTIAVTESSAGSPVLPAGVTSFGAVFAFTPHGTTFAVPVMITVPFTASSVPAGTTPALYKTNAAGAWERMPTATVNGTTLTAAVAGFSWAVAAGAVPPVIATQPTPQSVTEPGAATFNARATNAPGQSGTLTYQWEKSDDAVTFGPILGATDSTYTTRPTTVAADNGDFYRVLVSNGATATSNAVKLTVAPPPPPPPGPGTWQAVGGPVTIGPAGTTSRDLFAAVALDLAGNPVVAWKGRLVGPGTSTNFINVKQWNGSSWVQLGGNLMLANRNGDTYSTPSIDVDPASGQPVVAWAEESSRIGIGSLIGAFDVVVKRWNGGAWVQLGGALNADPTAGAVYPKLRIAPGGAPMVTWWETPNYIAAKHWDGLAWASFGQQSIVWRATGSQDLGLTALTLDGSNPVVLAGASGGPVASRPTPFPGTG